MTHEEELLAHPPTMAEMAGAAIDAEVHPEAMHLDTVPPGLARLEAETEE